MKRKEKKEKRLQTEDVKKLAERPRTIRTQKGYASHEIFAYEYNIPRAQYGRYERGENLRFDSLMKIIKAFDMTVEEFFSEGF
jgi:transcriptional regulator with XRE-family HTH domain